MDSQRENDRHFFCSFNLISCGSHWIGRVFSFFFRRVITIIPDCDGDPAVIIDVLLQSCTQGPAPVAPELGDRVSILQIHVEELIPKVLLLSCNEKKMWWASKSLSLSLLFLPHRLIRSTALFRLRYLSCALELNFQETAWRKKKNLFSWWVKRNIRREGGRRLSWVGTSECDYSHASGWRAAGELGLGRRGLPRINTMHRAHAQGNSSRSIPPSNVTAQWMLLFWPGSDFNKNIQVVTNFTQLWT